MYFCYTISMPTSEAEDTIFIPSGERVSSLDYEYRVNVEGLERSGAASPMLSGRVGFYAEVEGRAMECPLPSWQEIQGLIDKNSKLVERKKEQGFNGLLLTPFLPYSQWEHLIVLNLLHKDDQGKLFLESRDKSQKQRATLNREEPIWTWDSLKTAARNGSLIYFPKEYNSSHHGGKTQAEVILDPTICPFPGWSISLIETNPFLPKQGEGQTTGGRAQLENYKSPQEYLAALTTPTYQGESSFTIDDALSQFLIRLQTKDELTYDWDEYNGVWATGNYETGSGDVPYVYWDRGDRRFYVSEDHPGHRNGYLGTRPTVRLS